MSPQPPEPTDRHAAAADWAERHLDIPDGGSPTALRGPTAAAAMRALLDGDAPLAPVVDIASRRRNR